jgi:hypothetical protein
MYAGGTQRREAHTMIKNATPDYIVHMPCSGCMEAIRLNTGSLMVAMETGRPERTVEAEAVEVGPLIEWECPVCAYADSYEPDVQD